ncbi:hypothetical protein [Spongiibacter sp.]|uniref:hypothetical protein n=1 Tax=Spongiibacter sp. TaxID=2024860 RepID=UPI002579DD04|nr:hypothetical protein [Spongiibacter sp.]
MLTPLAKQKLKFFLLAILVCTAAITLLPTPLSSRSTNIDASASGIEPRQDNGLTQKASARLTVEVANGVDFLSKTELRLGSRLQKFRVAVASKNLSRTKFCYYTTWNDHTANGNRSPLKGELTSDRSGIIKIDETNPDLEKYSNAAITVTTATDGVCP